MSSFFSYRGYQIFSPASSDPAQTRDLVDKFLDTSVEPQHTFKDNPRTYCALFELNTQPLILKVPRGRNRRKWERFLTLFRESEGVRTFNNLELMHKLGLNAPTPLFAAEQRRFGAVVDSFVCYVFEEGRSAGSNDAREVISALTSLHSMGYLRTDPQPANFLISGRGVVFIDFRLKKPIVLSGFRKGFELAKLIRVYPESAQYLPTRTTGSASFKLARRLELWTFQLRQIKRKLSHNWRNLTRKQ